MLYTVSIKNLNGLNKVGQNLIDFNQVSPISVSSPETPYDSFISDTRYNLDGFVQIPLYNRQQYCNIPPNSILTITTENSTEAIYYSTIKIDGGSVTVDPDPISGKGGGGGGGTDEFAKKLLARDFENGTLVIPDYITELGPGAISGGFGIQTVIINPDNFDIDKVELSFYDYSNLYCSTLLRKITQQGESPRQDNLVFTNITTVIDLSDGKEFEKVNLFRKLCRDYVNITKYSNSTGNTLSPNICYIIDGQFLGSFLTGEETSNNDAWEQLVQMGVSDCFIDFRTCIKTITVDDSHTYISVNLDRDELPENIIFINYDKTANEWKNNLFYPDLQYVKGESFVYVYNVVGDSTGLLSNYFVFLDLENLPSGFSSVDFVEINSQQQLASDCITLYTTEYGTHTLQNIVYKTDIVKDGKNLFIFDNPSGCIALNTFTINSGKFLGAFFSYIYKDGCWYEMRDKQ